MKGKDVEMILEYPDFEQFLTEMKNTANFFVATHESVPFQVHAVILCMAYAYERGLKEREKNKGK